MTDNPVTQLVHYTSVAERLASSISVAAYLIGTFETVADLDSALAPEIMAAVNHVTEAVDALSRAERFARTRLEVALDEG